MTNWTVGPVVVCHMAIRLLTPPPFFSVVSDYSSMPQITALIPLAQLIPVGLQQAQRKGAVRIGRRRGHSPARSASVY